MSERAKLLVAMCVAAVSCSCAQARPVAAVQTTSATIDEGPLIRDPSLASVVDALVAGDDARSVALAEHAASRSPWLDYYRAVALTELGRTDDAVDAFKKAERRFVVLSRGPVQGNPEARPDSTWGASIAIYGRARALDEGHRCPAAREAYRDYARFASAQSGDGRTNAASHRRDAEMALAYAKECR